jgi:hypothetical protein
MHNSITPLIEDRTQQAIYCYQIVAPLPLSVHDKLSSLRSVLDSRWGQSFDTAQASPISLVYYQGYEAGERRMKKFLMHLPQIAGVGSVSLSKVTGYPMHSIFISLLNTSWLSNIQGQLKSARQMMINEGLRPIFPDTLMVPLLSGLTKRRYQIILECLENLDVSVSCTIDRLVWIRKLQESEKYHPLMEISFSGKFPGIRQGSLF